MCCVRTTILSIAVTFIFIIFLFIEPTMTTTGTTSTTTNRMSLYHTPTSASTTATNSNSTATNRHQRDHRMDALLEESDHERCTEANQASLLQETLCHLRDLTQVIQREDWMFLHPAMKRR